MNNLKIAQILYEVSLYLKMFDEDFKARAYERASEVVINLREELKDIYFKKGLNGLKEIKGIGNSIALKIEELILTNKLEYLNEFKKKVPLDLLSLIKIEGLGPKKIRILYEKLKIKNLSDLKEKALNGLIRNLPGFNIKSEENILKALEYLSLNQERFVLAYIDDLVQNLVDKLLAFNLIEKLEVVGSYRRKKETIGDLDILIICQKPEKIMNYLRNLKEVKEVLIYSPKRTRVKLENNLEIDLSVCSKDSFGSTLIFFTGSKKHVRHLEEIAFKKGLELKEEGLFKNKKKIAGRTEEEIYSFLGLDYIPPELREDNGEIELAFKKQLPKLVKENDLKGDLQVQSNYSDGFNSILELAESAFKRGLKYIAITDHSKNLKIAHGLNEERFKKQWQEIEKVNLILKKKKINFKVLKGIECDILKDGSLDFDDAFLKKFDIVGASIHSYFNLSKEEQTQRLIKAIQKSCVDIIFHPTGRIINKRPPYELDIEKVIQTAFKTKTVLEINAFPDRLDLNEEYIRKCINLGVKLSINSDAHSVNHFNYLKYGVFQARRGWAEKKDIINVWPLEKMLKMIKK